jgi:glycosyltransferase involved in cell wall biosynthesis
MQLPKVSVVIPNYNYAYYLGHAVESVLSQTYRNLEIVVVDDGSEDASEQVIAGYGERVRLIKQKNQGVSAARNTGVRETRGELVAFLDADDLWTPSKLERQVRCYLDDTDLGLVHCGVDEVDVNGNHLGSQIDGMEGWVARELLLFQRAVILGGGSAMLVPRAVFETIAGFDTRLSTSADWDFCYRIARRKRVGFVSEPLVKYRVHASNMHSNIKAMEHDMLLSYAKAFSDDDMEVRELRRRCYGNLHMVLAGSFFRAGQGIGFMRHALKSLWFTPGNVTYLLNFPLRRMRSRARVSV